MPKITDITFQKVNATAIADTTIGLPIFSFENNTISLNVETLTGKSFNALTDNGFIALMYKLNRIAAQSQVNVNLTEPIASDKLSSFPNTTLGLPSADGNIEVSYVNRYKVPLNIDNPMGLN